MKTSKAGINAIKKEEGLRLESYMDAAGVWTIGYGHTASAHPDQKIAKKKAEELLQTDLIPCERAVNTFVTTPLSQPQFDALVSFVFNVGTQAFKRSTLLKKLNKSDYLGAADEFLRWNKAGGKTLQGLVDRRNRERAMFLKGTGAVEHEHELETNIEPDSIQPVAKVSAKPVGAITCLAATGGALDTVKEHLEPLVPYSDYIGYTFLALSVLSIVFLLIKAKKED